MFKNYFITAFRNLWRNKFFSLINILGLSVGVACCMLIFLYAKDEISFDRFHANAKNIYRLTADLKSPNSNVNKMGSTGMMPGPGFKKDIPEIESYLRVQSAFFTVKNKLGVFDQEAIWADENLFTFFSFPLLYGNAKTALSDLHAIVISEAFAQKQFGKTNVVGESIQLSEGDGFETFIVSAVVKNAPQNSSLKFDMALPIAFYQSKNNDTHWVNFFLNTFVSLKPGADIKLVEAKMAQVHATEAGPQIKESAEKYGMKEEVTYHLQPLLKMHLDTVYPSDNGLSGASDPIYSYILVGIAAFILLIACINFINLTIARSLKRAKEIGIRKVIGSERKQLIAQFLGESFALSGIAFVLACCLTYLLLPFFNSVSNKSLAFSYLLDARLIGGYIGLFVLTGLLAGFYPALFMSSFKPVETLYGKLRFSGKNYISRSLVVFQFALSTFLIIATITIYSQFNYLVNFNMGYDDTNVVMLYTNKLNSNQLGLFKTELYKNNAIKKVTADQGGSWNTIAHVNGDKEIDFNILHIDADYFALFKIPLAQGRNFSEATPDSTESVIVNETFAKTAGWKNPLSEEVNFFYDNNKKFRVIGVAKDFNFETLANKIRPQMFTLDPKYRYKCIYVKIEDGNKATALRHIERTFKNLYPETPYHYKFVDEKNAEHYESEAKWKQIIAFSSVLTIFISCMGLFGLAALSAEKRAREIGIRKVLGASVSSIVQKLSADFLRLVIIASVIALPAAWYAMNKWLENYPYRIELQMGIFGFAIVLVIIVAVCTVSLQAIKAAIANPVKSLRTDL